MRLAKQPLLSFFLWLPLRPSASSAVLWPPDFSFGNSQNIQAFPSLPRLPLGNRNGNSPTGCHTATYGASTCQTSLQKTRKGKRPILLATDPWLLATRASRQFAKR